MAAIRLMGVLAGISEQLAADADPASPFLPPGSSLTVGEIHGGTAINILARECVFTFDLRTTPDDEPDAILAPFMAELRDVDAALKARFPGAGASVELCAASPPLRPEPDGEAERLARRLAGDNGPARAVAYAADAGQFQRAGFSTVICGPGSIDQAHQADEYLEASQLERGAAFMARLVEALQA
jgi:acetylornithine deacetylase